MATEVRQPIITRIWARDPAGVAVRSQSDVWQNQLTTNLRSQDKFFGAGGPNYDYPNPRAPARASDLRTWTAPINLNLLGQDKFFGAGGPNYDYPNPRAPARASDLITWVWPRNLSLYATQFDLFGHPNYDWPNPIRNPSLRLKPWISPQRHGNQDVFFGTAGNPNYDYPNPRGYIYANFLRGWIHQGNIQFGRVVGRPALAYASDLSAIVCEASDSPSGQNWSGEGYMAKYEIDTSIQLEAVFRDPLENVYVDPTEVQLFVLDPAGNIVDYTTLDGSVTRSETGHYIFEFVVDQSGVWTYKWQGTGVFVATSPDTQFTVNASALIAG